MNSGEFKTIRIGYAIRIFSKSFEDWLAMEEPEEETEKNMEPPEATKPAAVRIIKKSFFFV